VAGYPKHEQERMTMKLDRNLNADGRGKYGLIKNRRLAELLATASPADAQTIQAAMRALEAHGVLDWGDKPETEFFVMRLKDQNSAAGLYGYASEAQAHGDVEYAREIDAMADRAGPNHPNCKAPD
jgi:hypothetical protein